LISVNIRRLDSNQRLFAVPTLRCAPPRGCRLEIGAQVRVVAQHSESAEELQARPVVPLGKHHLPASEAD
jgi:hypothetical protein